MKEFVRKNPWLGLESYQEGEILYGRDNDIRALIHCILNNTETLLHGKSGIGKSSILNAGILPAARRHGYLPIIIRLSHKDKYTYLQQINDSIIKAIIESYSNDLPDSDDNSTYCKEYTTEEIASLIKEVVPCKNPESESIYEYFHRHTFHDINGERLKLLIIFDQFEEIFTLQEDIQKKKSFFSQWADMLNNVMPKDLRHQEETTSTIQEKIKVATEDDFKNILGNIKINLDRPTTNYVTDNNIHFVFTIREDFLSEFEYYSAPIPSLKQNRYGLRPINEEQAAQIILRPIPELIDESVAKLIIEKITGKKEFKLDGIPEIEVDSAVLSLYLNRLYESKKGEYITKELVEQKGGEIISDFYHDAISGIQDSSIEYLEDMLLNGQERRDNITVYDALNDGKVSKQELDILCNKKKILRQFYYAGDLRIEYVHDILCPIVAKNKAERTLRVEEELQNKNIKKLRTQRSISLLSILLLIIGIGIYIIGCHIPISERYASTTKEWGKFAGVEPLSKQEASYREYHFVLKKKGLFTETYSSMECRDRFGNLSTGHGIQPYILAGAYGDSILAESIREKLGMACQWEFIKDPLDKNSIIQERAYDAEHNLIYAFNYNKPGWVHIDNENKQEQDKQNKANRLTNDSITRIGSYVDTQGLPLVLLKEGYRFIRISYDDKGRDMLVEYFDWDGNPSTNSDGAYQTYYEYNDEGQMISISSLNMYGKRMIDNFGNCGVRQTYNGYRPIESLCVDEFGREITTIEGYSRVTYEYDEHGRQTKLTLWNKNEPVCNNEGIHIIKTIYDDNNNCITYQYYDTHENQITIIEQKFDSHGNQTYFMRETTDWKSITENRFDKDRKITFQKEINIKNADTTGIYVYEKVDTIETRIYKGSMYTEYINKTIYDSNNRIIEDAYYELDGITPFINDYSYQRTVHTYSDNGRDDLYRIEKDSIVYYDNNEILKIQVIESYPKLGYKETKYYLTDSDYTNLSYKITKCWFNIYNNPTEEFKSKISYSLNDTDTTYYLLNNNTYYLSNARNNSLTGCIDSLTYYKFPKNRLYYNGDTALICDVNGDSTITSDYILPEIYSGERNKKGIFIKCYDKGRKWDGVILASDQGFSFDDEEYSHHDFYDNETILSLNLTTMRVDIIALEDLDYWEIYTYDITQEEYDIYQEYYVQIMHRIKTTAVYGEVTEDEGYLVEQGLSGYFFILQWCDWNCTQSIDAFAETLATVKELPKDIILLPFEIKDDEIVCGDNLIHLKDCEGKLGLRIQGENLPKTFYQENVINRYKEYMREKQ